MVLIGPGLSTETISLELLRTFIRLNDHVPAVLDADALNLLSAEPSLTGDIRFQWTATPHIGEMSRLTGLLAGELKENCVGEAAAFAGAHGCSLILKDFCG
jgi:NAD(P)H-hydrate epimerase